MDSLTKHMGPKQINETIPMTTELLQIDSRLRGFLKDMVLETVQKYSDEIVSIALFGSATTREWVKGKSDIDFIVVVAHEDKRRAVEDSVYKILLRLDRKHELQLSKTCSTFAKHQSPIINLFYKVENALTFGIPFFVFSLNQIAFGKGTIIDGKIRVVTTIFDPISIFLAKMKHTGITIYGKDLIKEIRFSNSKLVKVRIALAPFWLLVMSLLSFPVDEVFSLKHSIKATVWACEDVLFALDFPLSNTANEVALISRIFAKENSVDLTHLRKTIALKSRPVSTKDISKGQIGRYIVSTILFILTLYHSAAKAFSTREHSDSG